MFDLNEGSRSVRAEWGLVMAGGRGPVSDIQTWEDEERNFCGEFFTERVNILIHLRIFFSGADVLSRELTISWLMLCKKID